MTCSFEEFQAERRWAAAITVFLGIVEKTIGIYGDLAVSLGETIKSAVDDQGDRNRTALESQVAALADLRSKIQRSKTLFCSFKDSLEKPEEYFITTESRLFAEINKEVARRTEDFDKKVKALAEVMARDSASRFMPDDFEEMLYWLLWHPDWELDDRRKILLGGRSSEQIKRRLMWRLRRAVSTVA